MHVDDFIDDYKGDAYARWMFMHFRLPATLQVAFRPFIADRKLFCTHGDQRFRVTGASRLGDVWLTSKHDQDTGYEKRVDLEECTDWGPQP
jgi:hypothetical protein